MKVKKNTLNYILLTGAITVCFLFTLAVCLSALVQTTVDTQNLTVVLDAGHGGIDGGVTGAKTGVKESEINLILVKKIKTHLEQAGVNVILTRKTDAGLYGLAVKGFKKRDMQKRKEIIESAAPALMLSIHQNAFPRSSRRGAQLFYRKDSASGALLASKIQEELNAMPECVKKSTPLAGDYYMLNCTNYTSVICECGFLSNPEDEALLLSAEYQEKISYSIYKGVISYLSSAAANE
ncbi:MAG: N-acetylmuramoyl-L-alanine amidase [Clostridia bacterium]|nr:N-acetylmuramoyl-L-alanine amidase [Clostridia bacterium]